MFIRSFVITSFNMMDPANQIIVKFTSNFPHLFDNVQKYLPLINNLLQSETENKFYMETIHEGLIFIYEDFMTFFLMNKPYSPEKIAGFLRSTPTVLDPLLFSENILDESNFPPNGVHFQYDIICSEKEEIADLLFLHFQSFLLNDVERVEQEKFDLVLMLKTFDNIISYLNLVVSMYSGILSEENKATLRALQNTK